MAKPMNSATQMITGTDWPNMTPVRSHSEWLAWFIIVIMLKVCWPVAGSVMLK